LGGRRKAEKRVLERLTTAKYLRGLVIFGTSGNFHASQEGGGNEPKVSGQIFARIRILKIRILKFRIRIRLALA